MTISMTKQAIAEPQPEEVVLSVKEVSKRFCRDLRRSLFYGIQDIASELSGTRGKVETLRPKEFWALDKVSFQLRRGESLGLVGPNGSGKSTLLKIIAGLIRPDKGYVETNGRIAPLIALGAGFNPILTGRENVYTNMSILGLSRKEINERFDEVLAFAEIGEAIDSPVQSYSSGMAARLGFSSAIHTEPDILLIDEVLAVGDSHFKGKCFQKLHDLRQKGTSFILVSHNPHSILTICESAVYLLNGRLSGVGDTAQVMSKYERDLFLDNSTGGFDVKHSKNKLENKNTNLEISSIYFRNDHGTIIGSPLSGDPVTLCVACKTHKKIEKAGFTISIKGLAQGGDVVLLLNCLHDDVHLDLVPGDYEVQIQMPYLGLRLGTYSMDVYAKEGLYALDSLESFRFNVEASQSISRSLFFQPRTWKVTSQLN